jgi:hypothetical protein
VSSQALSAVSTVSSVPSHVESDIVAELARWLADQATKAVARVVLAQKLGDSSHHAVDEWTTAELVDPHALAEVIYGAAVREAQTLRTSVAYGVFALRSDRSDPVGRYLFRIDAGGSGWLQGSETPDERGITAMFMRHHEAAVRLSLGHSRGILDQYERLIEQANAQNSRLLEQAYARIAALEAREIEALELRDKLQSMARERELDLAQLQRRDQMRMFAMEKISQFAPALLAKLGLRGDGSLPRESISGGTVGVDPFEVIEQLIVSLTSEQFAQMTAILQPGQLALLSTIFEIVEARGKSGKAPEAGSDVVGRPTASTPSAPIEGPGSLAAKPNAPCPTETPSPPPTAPANEEPS